MGPLPLLLPLGRLSLPLLLPRPLLRPALRLRCGAAVAAPTTTVLRAKEAPKSSAMKP